MDRYRAHFGLGCTPPPSPPVWRSLAHTVGLELFDMSAVDLDHALRSASMMYADDSCVEHSGYYFCLSSLGAVEVASVFPRSVACTGSTIGVAFLSFTLDSEVSSCFFRVCIDLTPLCTLVSVALADSIAGPVVARITTNLPCPAAPSGFLTGYYTPLFSRNLVGVIHLHDLRGVTTFPLVEPVASYIVGVIGTPLATFHREPDSGLYSPLRSGQVAAVSSLAVLHDPLPEYRRASRPIVSHVLSALVTHPTTPLSSVSALVTSVAGFASSHRLDYAAHLVSGPACSPISRGAPVFPLEVLKNTHFEIGFLAAAVHHL
ncbi:unnamed protein product [Closterium sp. NIES-53]